MQYIGKLNRGRLGRYRKKIVTDDIILTEERMKHIYESHKNDYDKIMRYMKTTILNPDEILESLQSEDTIFFIKKIDKNNLNVVIKLNTTNNNKHPKNSVMTAWIIRDKNLVKLRNKNKILYKYE